MSLADGVSFIAAASGGGDFTFGSSRPSFLTLSQAVAAGGLTNGQTVSYLAQNSLFAPTQREWGHGTFSASGSGSIARTVVLGTVDSNGASGRGSPLNFSQAPIVSLTALAEDFLEPATGNLTFYVATTGSDSNVGTLGSPFLTLQHAVNVAQSYDWLELYFPTISVGAGTFGATTDQILLSELKNAVTSTGPTIGAGQIIGAGPAATTINGNIQAQGGSWNFQSIGFNGPGWTFTQLEGSLITFNGGSGINFTGTNYAIVQAWNGRMQFRLQTVGLNGTPGNLCQLNAFSLFSMQGCTVTWAAAAWFANQNDDVNNYSTLQLANNTFVNPPTGGGVVANVFGSIVTTSGVASDYPSTAPNFFTFDSTSGWINNHTSQAALGTNYDTGPPSVTTIPTVPAGVGLGAFFSIFEDETNGPISVAFNKGGTILTRQIGNHINTQTGTPYVLALFDQEGIVEMNLPGANQVTVPLNATVAFPVGTKISISQVGAGTTTIAAAGGVTVRNVGALAGQYKTALLYKRGTDEWVQTNGAF